MCLSMRRMLDLMSLISDFNTLIPLARILLEKSSDDGKPGREGATKGGESRSNLETSGDLEGEEDK